MFENFDKNLLSDPDFKEDSVREVIIVPILSRLGYHPSGENTVARSKTLAQPFIYVGTSRHPVKIIPDYTLLSNDKPVMALDAKSPTESVTSQANIQQAYSYAIHPEIQCEHFALCNGKRLAVFSTRNLIPLVNIGFDEFESRWEEIEKHFLPKYLLNPELRKFAPDFGVAVSRLGMRPETELVMIQTRLGLISRVSDQLYSASVNTELAGVDHCVSFDFTPEKLPLVVAGLPEALRRRFSEALTRAPYQAGADLCIEIDARTHLGEAVTVEHETFIPLVVDEVLGSRFNPYPPEGGNDVPSHVFRLRDAFKIQMDNPGNA